jgi:hypothetical protein
MAPSDFLHISARALNFSASSDLGAGIARQGNKKTLFR